MSTLKVSAIQNAAAGSGGLVLAADGNVSGAGMDLIVSTSFTAQAAVSLDDCFTSEYDNYQIVYRVTHSTTAYLNGRMRVSGADDTGANYYEQYMEASNTTVSGARAVSATTFQMGSNSASGIAFGRGEIFSPALAVPTTVWLTHYAKAASIINWGKEHMLSTAYDGLTLYPSSGTITGTLRVYGLRN